MDFVNPTPSTGWRNRERRGFLERARGRFDLVMMFAVAHHLLVSGAVPLPEILGMVAELTTDLAIVEFIAPEDPNFRLIARGRDHLFAGLDRAVFEDVCRRYFRIVDVMETSQSTRTLYLLEKGAA
jgi:hypothetical protein